MPEAGPIAAASPLAAPPAMVTPPLARGEVENYLNDWGTDLQHGDFGGHIALRQVTRQIPSAWGPVHIEVSEPTTLAAVLPRPAKALGACLGVRGTVRVKLGPAPSVPQDTPGASESWLTYGRRMLGSHALDYVKAYAVVQPSQLFIGRGRPGASHVELLGASAGWHIAGRTVPIPVSIPLRSFDQSEQAMWCALTESFSKNLVDLLMSGFRPQILNFVNVLDLANTRFTLGWTGGESARWVPPDDGAYAHRQPLSMTPHTSQVQIGLACSDANKYGIRLKHTFGLREGDGVDTRVTIEGECFVNRGGARMQPGGYAPPAPPLAPPVAPGGRQGGYLVKLLQQIFATGQAQDSSQAVRLSRCGWQDISSLLLPTVALPPVLARWQMLADGQELKVVRTGANRALSVVSDRPIVLRPAADTTGWAFLQRPGLRWLDGLIARHLTVHMSRVTFSADGERATVQGFVRLGWFAVSFGKREISVPSLAEIDALAQLEALGSQLQAAAFEPLIPAVMALLDLRTDLQIAAKRGGQLTLNREQALIGQATRMLIRGDGASASLQAQYEHEAKITTQGGGRDTDRDVRVNASVSVQCGHAQPVAVA